MTNYQNMAANVAAFYAPDAVLLDPVGEHRGVAAIQKYYENLYKNAKSVRFEFTDEVTNGNQSVVMWKMYVSHPAIKGGEEITALGNSYIKFSPDSKKAIYHRDYFDLSEFVFDHVSVLGWITKKIKTRMKGDVGN